MLKGLIRKIRYDVNPAVKIAVIYAFFSFLWIVFSDKALEFFISDAAVLTKAQTIKGWFFVSISSLIIYVLIDRSVNDLRKIRKSKDKALNYHKTLFEEFPQPIYQMSPEGKMIYMNSKSKAQPGLNKSHLLDNSWLKYVHADEQHIALETYRKALMSESPYSLEFRLQQNDGNYKWFLDNGVPYYSIIGDLEGFISCCVDVTEKKEFENKLKNAMETYSKIFANNPHAMFVFDNDSYNVLEANNAVLDIYGYTREEFLDLNLIDICILEDINHSHKYPAEYDYKVLIKNCKKHIRKDNREIDVNLYIQDLSVFNGKPAGIIAVQDVTDSKKAYDDLLESENRFKTLFKSSPDINLVLSKQLVILDVNQAACSLFNNSISNLTGITLHELFDKSLSRFFLDMLEEIDNNGFSQKTVNSVKINDKDFSADVIGLYFWEKRNKRYYLSFKDISEKITMSKALQESERILNTLIDNLPGMVYKCKYDPHYTMEFISEGCIKITGYSPEQLEKNKEVSFGEIIHSEDKKRIWEESYENVYSGKTLPLIYRIIDSSNQVKWVLDQSRGIFDENNNLVFLEGFISDITDEKNTQDELASKMEELTKINEELERFTYTVSHDLRSPLVTITGFMELIRENALAGDFDQMDNDINRVRNATNKMHFLLEDLLQLSRIGRVSESFAEFSMDELLKETLGVLQGHIKKHNAEIIVKSELPDVYGIKSRMGEVWQNLIENALKFKDKDKDKSIVEIGWDKDDIGQIVYYVNDNGTGIDNKFHDKVFGLFNKLDPSTEGTGVGLTIVQRIIEMHGGKVWCESKGPGKGSKFFFTTGSANQNTNNF